MAIKNKLFKLKYLPIIVKDISYSLIGKLLFPQKMS